MSEDMIKKLEELRGHSLKDDVIDWLIDEIPNYDKGLDAVFEDLKVSGCSGGLVGHLIYHNDTKEFFNKHKKEINDFLANEMQEMGIENLPSLIGDSWDSSDPLIMEDNNITHVVWYTFETLVFKIENELEGE